LRSYLFLQWRIGDKGIYRLVEDRPNLLPKLQEIADRAHVVSHSANRLVLSDAEHHLVIRFDYDGTPKRWLLTAHRLTNEPPSAGRTTDIPGEPARARQDDTAPLPQSGNSSLTQEPDESQASDVAFPEEAPEIAGEADSKSADELKAEEAKRRAQWNLGPGAAQPLGKKGKDDIEDSPLFGGDRQGSMFEERAPAADTANRTHAMFPPGAAPRAPRTYNALQTARIATRVQNPALVAPSSNPLRNFYDQDVKANLVSAARMFVEAADDLLKFLAPAIRDKNGKAGALVLRHKLGELAHRYDLAEAALKEAWHAFAKRTRLENFDFIDRIENGQPQPTPELQAIADVLRKMLDQRSCSDYGCRYQRLEWFDGRLLEHANRFARPAFAVKSTLKSPAVYTLDFKRAVVNVSSAQPAGLEVYNLPSRVSEGGIASKSSVFALTPTPNDTAMFASEGTSTANGNTIYLLNLTSFTYKAVYQASGALRFRVIIRHFLGTAPSCSPTLLMASK